MEIVNSFCVSSKTGNDCNKVKSTLHVSAEDITLTLVCLDFSTSCVKDLKIELLTKFDSVSFMCK